METRKSVFEIKLKYIEEEIDIRDESLKNEVEEAGNELKKKNWLKWKTISKSSKKKQWYI